MAGQTEQVLSAILDSIDVGRLNPGDLIEEAALMKAHNVSRTPVREALLQLETAGLIQRLPRKGRCCSSRRSRNSSRYSRSTAASKAWRPVSPHGA
ncbi:winged helix-turn-helix domain-containing protein [Seohaeicola zhoushanensis]